MAGVGDQGLAAVHKKSKIRAIRSIVRVNGIRRVDLAHLLREGEADSRLAGFVSGKTLS